MKIYQIFLIVFLLSACAHDHSDHEGHDHGDHAAEAAEVDPHAGHDHGAEADGHDDHDDHEEGLHLTTDQVKTIGLKIGAFSSMKINDFVKATGTLGLPPNAYSSVNAKAEGFIRGSKKYVEGSYIKRGAVIAMLENPAFIERQQAYLETLADMTYLKQELARQQSLADANAGIVKNLQKIQADLARREAQKLGAEKYLRYLGFDLTSVAAGNIRQQIAIVAPISGYITTVELHNGLFVKPETELLEIVDDKHLHLELDVFEKDISLIKKEQKISYSLPAIGDGVFEGSVYVIGKEFNAEKKTVRIHGHLDGKRPPFIKDLFLNAKIWLNDQTVQALPESAVIKDGATHYIYATHPKPEKGEYAFEKIMVIPGSVSDGFVSVKLLQEVPADMKVVTEGAYYVYAQSKAGELKHEH